MRCWRIDIQRNLARYLHGELSLQAVKRLEDHLLDCGACRTKVERLRRGDHFARLIPGLTPVHDPWPEIEKAMESSSVPRTTPKARRISIKPTLAYVSTVLSLALGALLVIAGQQLNKAPIGGPMDLDEFHPVKISDLARTSMPHVMAEGYVSDVRANDEDGDLCFRLVDDLRQSGPFVVCEIIDSIKIQPPMVGSRVRVYGVSRFDNKEDHRWYEVHPVLNIEVLKD
jgi:hypothetical protein